MSEIKIEKIIKKTFETNDKEFKKLKSGKLKITELKNYDSLKLLEFLIQIENLLLKKITKKNFNNFFQYQKIISNLKKNN